MSRTDREHFQSYRHQTQIKHQILEKYLQAYFNVIGARHNNLVYIDGFAGPGRYEDESTGRCALGSPMRALQLIANKPELAQRVNSLFIESDEHHYEELKRRVQEFYQQHDHIKEPVTIKAKFADAIEALQRHFEDTGNSIAPTFLFVDPCGVGGAPMNCIAAIASLKWCEVFIFFNIDGVRRIAGLSEDRSGPTLPELLGSEQRAASLRGSLERPSDTAEKEHIILRAYMESLQEDASTQYILPFRIESYQRQTTSH